MSEQRVCPDCGGPVAMVQTGQTIRPGQPDYVHLDYRCQDPACGGSLRESEPGSMGGDNGGG